MNRLCSARTRASSCAAIINTTCRSWNHLLPSWSAKEKYQRPTLTSTTSQWILAYTYPLSLTYICNNRPPIAVVIGGGSRSRPPHGVICFLFCLFLPLLLPLTLASIDFGHLDSKGQLIPRNFTVKLEWRQRAKYLCHPIQTERRHELLEAAFNHKKNKIEKKNEALRRMINENRFEPFNLSDSLTHEYMYSEYVLYVNKHRYYIWNLHVFMIKLVGGWMVWLVDKCMYVFECICMYN